jgi:hypothetical protein
MEEAVFSIQPSLDKNDEVEVEGWVGKLKINYSVEILAGVSYLCWKIEETEQVFRIQASIVFENHGLNYKDHFSLTLKSFREDYLDWERQGFPEDWMKRYQKMFHQMILR